MADQDAKRTGGSARTDRAGRTGGSGRARRTRLRARCTRRRRHRRPCWRKRSRHRWRRSPSLRYQKWVKEDVAYIITNEERSAYKRLPTNAEREHFIEQFWLRRDPTPGTDANEFKEEHYRRIAYTNSNFSAAIAGWKTDRGRIYISYGPPDEKEVHPTGSASKPYPYEQWLYRFIEGVGKDVVVEFVDPERTGEFRMTADPSAVLLALPPSPTNGATVQVLAGKAMIALPLRWFEGHGVAITGRVLTKDGALVTAFEESVAGGTANS